MAYEMTAYCGLECAECPAYLATQADDMEALAKVAAEWSKQFGMEIPANTILCDGCKSDTGRICVYCGMCAVHSCAEGRALATCAHCDEFGCETLVACPGYMSQGRENLEKIRASL
ncbi:MAG: DUF3795 domain-containing protein [Actinobacteria bacterium]|nr:DUF3795 domain-containing protein [Actinomycetota bacterium]MBU1944528.1 DUF3795 domain-containing protein [Actinomycetota bacterium]MBU2689081.1 DUF3795 domain-containing protein [Actinomycetota bacterium]